MVFWQRVDEAVDLLDDEVQVWRVSALQSAAVMEACRARLSAEELKRVGRTRAGFTRDEFVVGRALLRVLVGRANGQAAEEVVFQSGPHGKPYADGVEFNVSHSRGMVLLALCRRAPVGVDVEGTDGELEALEIAEGTFSRDEVARLRALHGEERTREFLSMWTRKEALTKAHGDGLTMELGSFSVADGAEAVRLPTGGGTGDAWYAVRSLDVGAGFAAALAMKGEARELRCFEMDSARLMAAMR